MKSSRMLLTGAVLAAFAVWFVASAPATPSAPAGTQAHVQQLQLTIVGSGSTEAVSPSLGNIAIAAGVPVRMTVTNFSHEYHTFTIPGLHVSALIFPARGSTPTKTTFTFTASRQGIFKWYCAFCALGVSEKPHTMGGTVYVVINPAALA